MTEVKRMEIPVIIEESKKIEPQKIAEEILEWLSNNVENYVDNKTKLYKIDLVIDSNEMPMTKKLQDLYMSIPEDEEMVDGNVEIKDGESPFVFNEASGCRRKLDEITEKAYEEISGHTDELNRLFRRLIFFYEKIIMNPENKRRALQIDESLKSLIEGKEDATDEDKVRIQEEVTKLIEEGEKLVKWEEFEGAVSVTKFDYEAFSVGVKLSSKPTDDEVRNGEESEVMKEYTIPEGFVVWMEINYRLKARPTVLF